MVARGRKSRGPKGKKLKTIDRKPIRPLERQRMRPWLIELLDSRRCHQLVWLSRNEKTFRVAWKHAAGQTFDPESDASLFELWARHTGKYYPGDKPDPKKWKANFRCALNSLQDVDQDQTQGEKKGEKAFKVYKFLEEKKQKKEKKSFVSTSYQDDEDSEDEYRPNLTARGTKSRPKQVVPNTYLDSEGSETGSSPGRMDWNENCVVEEERSPLPNFDELCKPFITEQQLETIPEQRVPETHSPQVSDDNDDEHSNCSNITDEEIVDEISNMMTEQPGQFWSLLNSEAPAMYIDSTDSICGPSVIVETESQYVHEDYQITSLDYSQL